MDLLEMYAPRINMAERKYNEATGSHLTESKKIATAQMLDNISRRMVEALDNSVAVQGTNLGAFKKFALL